MIEVKGITKRFGDFTALDDLSLTVPTGAVYGLVGPNGSGKSTIIRHITGIYRPDAGEILIDGQPVYENPQTKARIAYIPDDVFYFNNASMREMAKFYAGIYPNFSWERFEKLLEIFPLDPKCPIRRFSKGMQKQAAFVLCMAMQPEIMVLDEPIDGLDPVMRRQVWSLVMADIAERNTTVLVSSHNLRELEDVCDHVGILDHGKLLLERSLSEMQENICKILIALPDGTELPTGLDILHKTSTGKLLTLIVRGKQEELTDYLNLAKPLFMDAVPLTLEEIFIYELGGVDYEVKDIIV
ncbi:MAG: ABC transporter ATP-binding protein [Oscillospiraceae bacterium]|nr:ABC transporter ATP-binding protein [Oscillospiraceae bacterium]